MTRAAAAEPRQREPAPLAPEVEEKDASAELRFIADSTAWEALKSRSFVSGTAAKSARIVCEGYDTEFFDLSRAGLELQTRRLRGRRTAALARRAPSGLQQLTVAPAEADVQAELFDPAHAELVVQLTQGRPLRQMHRAEFRRFTAQATFEGAKFTVAFDEGEILAGAAREPIGTLEVRRVSGPPAALYRFGLTLVERGFAHLASESLMAAGLRLAGAPAQAVRATAPEFGPEATLDEATGALLTSCLSQFLANTPLLKGEAVGEAVHQLRVALRRLRSALGILRPVFASPEVDAFRTGAEAIANAFGEARDWDVLQAMIAAGPAADLPEIKGFPALLRVARDRMEMGRTAGAAVLAEASTARFVLSLQAFIATRGWRNTVPDGRVDLLAAPASQFAVEALDNLRRKVRKRGRDFETLEPEARHRLRIALKQLRYGCEFFGHLYRPTAARQFAKSASGLQDMLGEANDAAIAGGRIASLDLTGDAALSFAGGAVVGWCARAGQSDERVLCKAWRAFRKQAPFWRAADDRVDFVEA